MHKGGAPASADELNTHCESASRLPYSAFGEHLEHFAFLWLPLAKLFLEPPSHRGWAFFLLPLPLGGGGRACLNHAWLHGHSLDYMAPLFHPFDDLQLSMADPAVFPESKCLAWSAPLSLTFVSKIAVLRLSVIAFHTYLQPLSYSLSDCSMKPPM